MSENYTDPSGNTQQFRAFVDAPDAAASAEATSRLPLFIGVGLAVVLLAVAGWLVLG